MNRLPPSGVLVNKAINEGWLRVVMRRDLMNEARTNGFPHAGVFIN